MIEPFMIATSREPGKNLYALQAPIRFKSPDRHVWLVPMDSQVISGDRPLYTKDDARADEAFWKNAVDNTSRLQMRMSVKNDMVSIRSAKSADTPGTAALLLPGKNRRARVFKNLDAMTVPKGLARAQDCYFIFITPDEALLADKSKLPPTTLKRMLRSIRNQLESTSPGMLLAAEVLEYDADEDLYREV